VCAKDSLFYDAFVNFYILRSLAHQMQRIGSRLDDRVRAGESGLIRVRDWKVMRMKLRQFLRALVLIVTLFGLIGCSGEPLSRREKGTLLGGALGAGGGALVGAAVGHPGAGAAIGGVGGAVAGYAIGNHEQNEHYRRHYRDYQE
jgi:osmotically inducible lipoprotein OsmB